MDCSFYILKIYQSFKIIAMDAQKTFQQLFLHNISARQYFIIQNLSIYFLAYIYLALAGLLVITSLAMHFDISLARFIFLISFMFVGWCQYALSIVMHEAIHNHLTKNQNDFWVWIGVAYPIFQTKKCKAHHLNHHKFLGSIRDPDFSLYNNFPKSKIDLFSRLLYFGLGIHFIVHIFSETLNFFLGNSKNECQRKNYSISGLLCYGAIAIIQLILFSAFSLLFNNPIYFLYLWVLPCITVKPLLSSVRFMCEHGSPEGWVIRSIDGVKWRSWIFAPLYMGYHFEHHSLPRIPCSQLKQVNNLYTEKCIKTFDYKNPNWSEHVIFLGDHFKFIDILFKSLPWKNHP
jgi:fatty acid desaturase